MIKYILLLFLLPLAAEATIYYADPAGGDTSAGTVGDPWSISTACSANVLVKFDTVYLEGGTYDSATNFGVNTFEPQTVGIYYRSVPGEWAQINGSKGSSANNVVGTVVDSITLDSIGIMYGSNRGINVSNDGAYWTLKHCRIDSAALDCTVDNNEGGISNATNTEFMNGWLIDSCDFKGNCGRGPIHVYGMQDTEIRYCFFEDNIVTEAMIYIKGGVTNGTNSGNNFHHNTADIPTGGDPGGMVGWSGIFTVRDNLIHHNISYGTTVDAHYRPGIGVGTQRVAEHHHNYFYNNTIDLTVGFSGLLNTAGTHAAGDTINVDTIYIFNNIFFRAPDFSTDLNVGAITSKNNASLGEGNGSAPFGNSWWGDNNAYVTRSAGDDIYGWATSGPVLHAWTLAQWTDSADELNSTYVGDSNSISFSDSSDVFIDRGARDYALDPDGANFTTMSTSGGGPDTTISGVPNIVWDTYMGAVDPNVYTRPIHRARK